MRQSAVIWNNLHDGSIVAFEGICPGEMSLKVEIEYLCEVISKGSAFLWVRLHGCSELSFVPYGSSNPITEPADLSAIEPEVLNATDEDDHVTVCCQSGLLRLSYDAASLELDDGTLLTSSALVDAGERYWSDWEQRE